VFYERVYYKDGKTLDLEPSMPVPEDLSDSYLINHSASILLVNPAGKLHAVFAPPHDPQTIISDLAAIQAGWRS
jgi:cytochrome oxidase Cu insertion factor (SCO1/SenC/PrrC family)